MQLVTGHWGEDAVPGHSWSTQRVERMGTLNTPPCENKGHQKAVRWEIFRGPKFVRP